MLIGQKIRTLRRERNMSLTELAQQSGIQLATLSRIENMKMTGTLESHTNIARALGVNLVELYSDIQQEEKRVEKKTRQTLTDIFVHSDKSSYEILTGTVLTKRMMPVLLRIEPNGKTNVEQNKPGTEKFIFVLEGKIDARIGEESYPLAKHNTLYFDASVKHCLANAGTATAKVLCVTTPVAL